MKILCILGELICYRIDEETYIFLEKSRLMRNRISHRYKEPSHEELFSHIVKDKDKIDTIIEIASGYLK